MNRMKAVSSHPRPAPPRPALVAAAATAALPASWVRSVTGWPSADDACGRGLRIGMIDATGDSDRPALVGRRIAFRSFHSRHRRPAAADQGAAVAAVGRGDDTYSWGFVDRAPEPHPPDGSAEARRSASPDNRRRAAVARTDACGRHSTNIKVKGRCGPLLNKSFQYFN